MSGAALLISGMQSRLLLLQTSLLQLDWQVAPFLNPQEALESTKTVPYEAAFCDEQVRGASLTGLLVGLRRLVPELPVYVFSNVDDSYRFRLSGARRESRGARDGDKPPTSSFYGSDPVNEVHPKFFSPFIFDLRQHVF